MMGRKNFIVVLAVGTIPIMTVANFAINANLDVRKESTVK